MALVVYAPPYLKLLHDFLTLNEQVMPIEAKIMPGTGIQLTGKLGEVIRESAQIALSFIKAHAHLLGLAKTPEEDLLEKKALHLHMPEGGIGKEWVAELRDRHLALMIRAPEDLPLAQLFYQVLSRYSRSKAYLRM